MLLNCFNLVLEDGVLQALHVLCFLQATEGASCRCLGQLVRQRELAIVVFWQQLQIFVKVSLHEACLGCKTAFACLDVIEHRILVFLGVLVNVGEVALVHHLADCILLGVDVLNLELVICNDYEVLNHCAKVVVTHHEVLLRGLFSEFEEKAIGASGHWHVLHGQPLVLPGEELCRHEYLPLVGVHPKDIKFEAEEDWLVAYLEVEDRDLVDSVIEISLPLQVFLWRLLEGSLVVLICIRLLGEIGGVSIGPLEWRICGDF